MSELDFRAMPHEVTISTWFEHSGHLKELKKVFPTEAEAIAFAETIVPAEYRAEGRAARYDELIWRTNCNHIEWCVSVGLHMESLVTYNRPHYAERLYLAAERVVDSVIDWLNGRRKHEGTMTWDQERTFSIPADER